MQTDQTSDEENVTYDPVIEEDSNENSIRNYGRIAGFGFY